MIPLRQCRHLKHFVIFSLALSINRHAFADAPGVAFSTPEIFVNELTGQAELSVQRVGAATDAFSVDYSYSAGNGGSTVTNIVEFGDGENAKSITINFPDNTIPNDDRDLQIELQNPSVNAVLAAPVGAVVHIADNDAAGGVDPSFVGSYGRTPFNIVRQSNGSVIVVADNTVRVDRTRLTQLSRFAPDGSLDSSFVTPSFFYTRNILVDSADRILFISQQETELPKPPVILGRLKADGTLDPDFQTNTLSHRATLSMLLLSDGSVILGKDGSTSQGQQLNGTNLLERFSAAGERIPFASTLSLKFGGFDPNLANGTGGITALAQEPQGTVLVGATINAVNGQTVAPLLRLDLDGNLDATFSPSIAPMPNSDVRSLAVLGDASILVGGAFRLPGASTVCHLVRLTASGALDPGFTPVVVKQGRTVLFNDAEVWQIIPESTGSIFIRGPFEAISGETHLAIAKIGANGLLDSSFQFDRFERSAASIVVSMFLDETRGLTVAGKFSKVDFATRTNLVRVLTQSRGSSPKQSQTITFDPIPDQTFSTSPISLSARASSGLPVTFTVVSGSAVIDAGGLKLTGSGAIVVQADQAGDDTYDSAPPVRQTFTVSKASQNIDFQPVIGFRFRDPNYPLKAAASSGLAVSFQVISGPANLSMNNAMNLIALGAGTAVVRALQAGDERYESAFAEQSVAIGKALQTITFNTPAEIPLEYGVLKLDAAASSSLPVTYELLSGPATLNGDSLVLSVPGTVLIRITQPGNENFEAAPAVESIMNIVRKPPQIGFSRNGSSITIFWPAGYGAFLLQESESPVEGWIDSPLPIFNENGALFTLPLNSGGSRFFRVLRPGGPE